jgi:hypothetical protein
MFSFSKIAITITLSLFTRPAAAQEVSAEYFEPTEWEVYELTPTVQPMQGSGLRLSAPPSGSKGSQSHFQPESASKPEISTANTRSNSMANMKAKVNPNVSPNVNPKSNADAKANGKSASIGEQLGNLKSAVDQVDVIVDKVINTGKKVWAVVEAGKPVVNVRSDVATALPATTTGAPLLWTQMENWRRPESKLYGAVLKNAYGVEVVRFSYRVLYVAGGSVNGQGQYIGYATIQPAEVNVAWGYDFKVTASAPAVFNLGSSQNPIAGMNLELAYTVKTVLKEMRVTKTYFISGDGQFQEVQ